MKDSGTKKTKVVKKAPKPIADDTATRLAAVKKFPTKSESIKEVR